jgi:excisionase family DNA binding protein
MRSTMAHAAYLREKARSMRVERQFTIDELAERLALSRSTIYYWVRDLPIAGSNSGRSVSARRRATKAMQRRYRGLREAAYEEGLRTFDELAARPTFIDFVCMYIGEGYKRDRNKVSLANSDPAVLQLATKWIRRLSSKRLFFWIQYHADQDLDGLCAFWGDVLAVDPSAIRLQRKSNSGQLSGRQWRSRHGVLSVVTHDTLFRARLEAWMHLTRESWL